MNVARYIHGDGDQHKEKSDTDRRTDTDNDPDHDFCNAFCGDEHNHIAPPMIVGRIIIGPIGFYNQQIMSRPMPPIPKEKQ